MYLRSTSQTRKDGSVVRYLQLAHNVWDGEKGRSETKVLYNFGREQADTRDTLERLVRSITRYLHPGGPDEALAPELSDFTFMESRPMGGAYVLDALWRALGIGETVTRLLAKRRRDRRAERALFALVANRALSPSSKLAASAWVNEDVEIPGLATITDDALYRSMDFLLEIAPALEKAVFHEVANLLNLEVDLLFFDTTSTYFCIDEADDAVERDGRGEVLTDDDESGAVTAGFRTYGKSKDHRDDLPQIVVGLAVTREGIPVRVWSWPGNTSDSALIRQVKADLREWTLSRVVWVADRGFTSAENRRFLRRGDDHYIMGEKLRSGSKEARAALSRAGRYCEVAGNLKVKEVKIGENERFVVCHNPEAAERDACVRAHLLDHLTGLIKDSDRLPPMKRAELKGVISTKPGLSRFLRATAGGLLRIDAEAIAADEKLDGKYLLRTSDPNLSAEDIALGYKQLAEVERGWRGLKHVLDLRPVYHRKEERIRAHVLLCWLALLLIRIAETKTGDTWPNLRRELERLQVGTFEGSAGFFRKRTALTTAQKAVFRKLQIQEPAEMQEIRPAIKAS
jgi:transposase